MDRRRWVSTAGWTVAIIFGLATGVAVQRLWMVRADVEELAEHLATLDTAPESTLVYDAKNELVSALFEEHRIGVLRGIGGPRILARGDVLPEPPR